MVRFGVVMLVLLGLMAPADAQSATRLVELARSGAASDHEELAKTLGSTKTVSTLLAEEEASVVHRKCGVGAPPFSAKASCEGIEVQTQPLSSILCALASNPTPSAQDTLVGLTKKRFAHDTDPGDMLLKASSLVGKPGKKLTSLWIAWGASDGGAQNLMDTVLLENGSAAARGVYLELMTKVDEETRLGWAQGLKFHRQKIAVLELATELLRLPATKEAVHSEVVRAIFDMSMSKTPFFSPPPWSEARDKTKARLRRLARVALANQRLPPDLRSLVKTTLQDL